MTLRQNQALQLLLGDLAEYAPRLDNNKEECGFFDVKAELYRLPSSIIQEVSLFYGIKEKGTWARLQELREKQCLSEEGQKQLSQLFDAVLRYRMKAHLFYQREHEALYHPKLLDSFVNETGKSNDNSNKAIPSSLSILN